MVPRENKNNAYAKFGGQTKIIMVFSEVAYLAMIMSNDNDTISYSGANSSPYYSCKSRHLNCNIQ